MPCSRRSPAGPSRRSDGADPTTSSRPRRRAARHSRAWSARPVAARAAVLLRTHDLLLARQEQALDLIQLETGKARRHAFEEIADAANVLRYYAARAPGWLAPSRRRGAVPLLTKATREIAPVGVVAVIVPWNYPLNLFITDVTPALVSGNAVVVMPDQQTSFTALWALALLQRGRCPRRDPAGRDRDWRGTRPRAGRPG